MGHCCYSVASDAPDIKNKSLRAFSGSETGFESLVPQQTRFTSSQLILALWSEFHVIMVLFGPGNSGSCHYGSVQPHGRGYHYGPSAESSVFPVRLMTI